MNEEYNLSSLVGKTIKEIGWVDPASNPMIKSLQPLPINVFIKFTDGFSIKFDMDNLGVQEPEGYNGPGMYETRVKWEHRLFEPKFPDGSELTFNGEKTRISSSTLRFQADSLEHAKSLLNLDEVEYVKWIDFNPKLDDYGS